MGSGVYAQGVRQNIDFMKILILLTSLFIAGISNAQDTTEYIVTVYDSNPYTIGIIAKFSSKVDTLSIHPACPNYDYPNGWSTFIRPNTNSLDFIGDSKWTVNHKSEISYNVDLSFVNRKWDVGNEQAGIYKDSSIFVVTRALFLTSNNHEKYKVSFNLPSEYNVIAPWRSIGTNRFMVDSKEELSNNTIVWGKVSSEKIRVKDFNLQFVLLSYEHGTTRMVGETFESILKEYLEIFPETPRSDYLITVFPFEQNDGEAYSTSNAFTLKSEPSSQNKMIWANQFAHELFHYWNGRMINGPERSKRQWFSEGATEYFANLALVRSNTISEKEFYRLIEKTVGLYFYYRNRQYPEVSLVEAGSEKSKYRFGVYNGGWCAAFVMDMIIREKTSDQTLSDFMNTLFRKYGLKNRSYVLEDLEMEFAEFLDIEDSSFFKNYIFGIEELPVEEYLDKIGVRIDYTSYEGTAFIFNDVTADHSQIVLRNKWLKD